jgi:hypothetical protein
VAVNEIAMSVYDLLTVSDKDNLHNYLRVHDQIWREPHLIKWHVHLWHNKTTYALLTVTRSKLVTKFRPSDLSEHNFDTGESTYDEKGVREDAQIQ